MPEGLETGLYEGPFNTPFSRKLRDELGQLGGNKDLAVPYTLYIIRGMLWFLYSESEKSNEYGDMDFVEHGGMLASAADHADKGDIELAVKEIMAVEIPANHFAREGLEKVEVPGISVFNEEKGCEKQRYLF